MHPAHPEHSDFIQSISELSKKPSALPCPQGGPQGLHFAITVFPSIYWPWRPKPQEHNSTAQRSPSWAQLSWGCPLAPQGKRPLPHSQPEVLSQTGSCQLEPDSLPIPEPGLSQTRKSHGLCRLGRPGVGQGEKRPRPHPHSPATLPAKATPVGSQVPQQNPGEGLSRILSMKEKRPQAMMEMRLSALGKASGRMGPLDAQGLCRPHLSQGSRPRSLCPLTSMSKGLLGPAVP